MLVTSVCDALQDLIDWVPDGQKYGTKAGTIQQNILGTRLSNTNNITGAVDIVAFCTVNGVNHHSDIRAKQWDLPRAQRFLPAGVGEFAIVWYMQRYPNLYSTADVMPWYSYLVDHGFNIDGLLEPIAMTTPQDAPEVQTVTISVDTSIDLTSWLEAAFEALQSETLRRAMVDSLIPA